MPGTPPPVPDVPLEWSRRRVLGTAVAGAAVSMLGSGSALAAEAATGEPAASGTAASRGTGPLAVERLTTEYAERPLGTDARIPRLSWVATAPGHGATQSAYQVLVATRPELLAVGKADVWDSGRVPGPRSVGITYGGPALAPRTRYHWRVRLTDGRGTDGDWSAPSWFETGLLAEGFGTARWIGPEPTPAGDVRDLVGATWIWSPGATSSDAPEGTRWFRGALEIPAGTEITGAHLVVTADDDYTAFLNGAQVLTNPQQTDSWKTAETVDITTAARTAVGGRLVIAAAATNRPGASVNPAGLLVKLVVRTATGELVRVTDGTWRSSATEQPGWEQPAFDDSGWEGVAELAPYGQGPWGNQVGISVPELPAPLLRRGFRLDKPVRRARLYASGVAYADLQVNGRRVGDAVLDPGFTDYDETVLYVTHDVTALLRTGDNVLGAELGRGFYGLTTPNVWRWHQPPWHGEPRLLARLVVEHTDGTVTELRSDTDWRVTEGPTLSNSQYSGETYDARLAPDGWASPGFDDSGWDPASALEAPAGTLRAQENEPIRIQESIDPVRLSEPKPGTWVADFGRTTAGWARLRVRAPAGTTIRMLYGEKVRDDGTVEASTGHVLVPRYQLDEFVASGNGEEEWEPRFSYKGFRYVQLTGLTEAPTTRTVTMRELHSDVRDVATFESSQPMYDQLEKMMRRTVRNNLHSIPTDTPMYEKNGWTGDAQVGAPTMAGTLDLARFFTKWLGDLRDSQVSSGQLPVIVPSGGWGYAELAPTPEWTTVYPFVLREMHRWYGDERLLDEHWTPVLRYLDWELGRLQDGLAPTALGDWAAPGRSGGPPEDPRLTATSYLHRALIAIAEVGEMTGRGADAARLRTAADGLRTRLNEVFLDRTAGHYRTDRDPEYRQASNAVPLAFGLVPDDQVQAVVDSLVADIEQRGFHLNTGCLGTSVLLPVLTAHGHPDVAAKVALQRTYPSWGYWIDNGADTMWEYWELGSRSRDHYFEGTVVQWLLENVAGLRSLSGGWERFAVRPDARSQVSWARLRVDTVRGEVSASWRITDDAFQLDVVVPVGATADVHVPAAAPEDVNVAPSRPAGAVRTEPGYVVHTVGSGRWRFVSRSAPAQ